VKQVTPQTVNLTWQQLPTNDLEGFQVIGSTSAEGEYKRLHEKLLAPTERMFQFDISGELLQYYRILAVDTAKNAAASDLAYLVTVDTIPPVVPTDMKIEIDTNRVVTLSWSASSSKDIKGYRLMKAYHPSNGFSPITAIPITGLSYTDTIPRQRVDRNVYYQLVALDQNFNHSDPADFVAAIIPDDIPPTSPLLSKVEILDDKAVEISWKASSSRDVASYKVYRIFDEDTTTTEFLINETNATSYIDREFDNNHIQFATYAVACVDSSGNISERSNARRIFSKKNAHLKALKISNIVQVESKVQIEWATKAAAKQVILIYRKQDDKRFELLARAKDEGSYIDKKVKAGSSYQYKIGILEESGKKSPLSESVSVKVK
jgi:fibronectin type 3 domain-containing protein